MESLTGISQSLGAVRPAAGGNNELGQEDFMRLMVAQLQNQDPTKPMDNFQFLSQIAQFSTVDGIQGIEDGFGAISQGLQAGRAMEAASLVGRSVVTESNLGVLSDGQTLDATIDVPSNVEGMTLYIQDMDGNVVHTRTLETGQSGATRLQWDGVQDDGEMALPGQYRVSVEAQIGGQGQALPVYAHSRVESVSIDPASNQVSLSLASGANVALSSVKTFF